MVYGLYTKRRILFHDSKGLSTNNIVKALFEEDIAVSKSGVWKFLRRYKERGNFERKAGSGKHSKINKRIELIVDGELEKNDETTGLELCKRLREDGHTISVSTALRCRKKLGWTHRGSSYCQLIRDANKVKRVDWAKECINDDFANVIFTDECSIQLEAHRRRACHRIGHPPKPKPRYTCIIGT